MNPINNSRRNAGIFSEFIGSVRPIEGGSVSCEADAPRSIGRPAKGVFCLLVLLAFSIFLPIGAVAGQSEGAETDVQFTDYEALYLSILDFPAWPQEEALFALLPEPMQAMFIVAIFDMEVQNGGLCQFFVNCGAAYATRTASCLQTIGLEPMKILYESFLSDHQIDQTDYGSLQGNPVEAFLALYRRYPFDDFDDAYMELWEALDFRAVMLQYANDHPEVFMHTQ